MKIRFFLIRVKTSQNERYPEKYRRHYYRKIKLKILEFKSKNWTFQKLHVFVKYLFNATRDKTENIFINFFN